jgi:hypothetical protein
MCRLTTSLRTTAVRRLRTQITFRIGYREGSFFLGFCVIGGRNFESSSTSVLHREVAEPVTK